MRWGQEKFEMKEIKERIGGRGVGTACVDNSFKFCHKGSKKQI
jgi:hypothetical protein